MQKQVRLIEIQATFVESFWNILFAASLSYLAGVTLRAVSKPAGGIVLYSAFGLAWAFALFTGVARFFQLRKQVCKLEQALNEGGSGEGDRR